MDFDFAFIRLGYRGYGQEGNIRLDKEFHQNIQNAQAAGFDVGVYFFAQAINEEEALEEANFVLQNLQGYTLQLPVVYDPESILDDEARTDNVSGEQFTKNTEAFCSAVSDADYEPMIYANMLWEAFELDLEKLSEYPLWYADYEPAPQTPYHFRFWQYTQSGTGLLVSTENVDLNIQLISHKIKSKKRPVNKIRFTGLFVPLPLLGLEPTTTRLTAECSLPTELRRNMCF